MAIGFVLLGFFLSAGPKRWDNGADLALFALSLLCVALGAYVFAQFYITGIPSLPAPRRRSASTPPALPPFLTARGQLNTLVQRGQTIRAGIPANPGPGNLAAALAGVMTSHHYLWRVAGWHAMASEAVYHLAPASSALFDHTTIPTTDYETLRAFMGARIAELQDIMRALP